MAASVLAELLPDTPTFLDDLTPDSGLALRRWSEEEYRRMAYPAVFRQDERTELRHGEVIVCATGLPRLFTRDEYYRLAEHEILQPGERTELIYGRIVQRMSPLGEPHNTAVRKALYFADRAFPAGYMVRPQMSLRLSSGLELEPDIYVARGQWDENPLPPAASQGVLLIEVSDSTLRYDRGAKAHLYAADGIADYWILNLRQRTLEIRRDPRDGEYQSLETFAEHETVSPLAAPLAPVRVADLLPLKKD